MGSLRFSDAPGETITGTTSSQALDPHVMVSVVNAANSASPTPLTLADGGYVGQLKVVHLKSKPGAGNAVLTPANFTSTTITFDAANEYALLLWNGAEWASIGTNATATVA